jgi:GYF domain 2
MTNQWFYGRGSEISGPVSGSELASLAAAGKVLPSDTIWLEGRESGVPAAKVKNLFPAKGTPPVTAPVAEPDALPSDVPVVVPPAVVEIADLPATPTAEEPAPAESAPASATVPRPAPARAARATAGKGAVIIGQDGKTVKYRGKCSTCGKEDSSWKSVAIPRGTARFSFFCPKCRKRQEVELYGIH